MTYKPFFTAWGSLAAAGLVFAACATGTVTEFEDEGNAPSQGGGALTSGTGGTGGTGGNVSGTGGEGNSSNSNCVIDCSTIATPSCQLAQCNEVSGQCEVVNSPEGTMCDDELFCTVDDACIDGMCIGGPQNDCGINQGDCDDIVCDEASKSCSTTPKMNGAPCTNSDLCQVNSTCQNGLCSGIAKDCFFAPVPDECHVALCNPMNGNCEPVPGNDNDPCVDINDLCTVSKTCLMGLCQGGAPKDCSNLTQGCVLGVCDVVTGMCGTKNLMNGDMCDDKDGCTQGEKCMNGTCSGGVSITQCTNGDNCCPMQCDINNDNDCNLCGNNIIEVAQGEENDPPPGPAMSVPLDINSCRYDFSMINQWYCNGTCGSWDGQNGCGQGDADVFCKLKMDNANSTAITFGLGVATAAPGICCPPPTFQPGQGNCIDLGVLGSRGVTTNVSVHDTSLVSSHGAGQVITTLNCTNP